MSQVSLLKGWIWTKIGDLCLPVENVNFRKRAAQYFRYIDISSIDREQKSIAHTDLIDNAHAPSRARQVVLQSDILVSTVRPSLNAVAIVPPNMNNEICSTGFCVLRANVNVLDPEYLFAWVRSSTFIQRLVSVERGIGYPAVNNSDIENIFIPLPPLPEQRRIAAILREADAIRRLRRETNEKMQKVIEALFYNLFGDPATNPKKWDIVKIENFLAKDRKGITTGPFGSLLKRSELLEEGIPVWGINNVSPNNFVETNASFISLEKYQQLRGYTVQEGDILISRAGTVGRLCVAYPTSFPSIINTNLIKISVDNRLIHPEYFTALFTYFVDRLGKLHASGEESSYSFLNPSTLRSLQIPLPPLSLQNEFVSVVLQMRQGEKLRDQFHQRYEILYQSLLAQAFTGELTATWREAHALELAQAAQERDEQLRQLHRIPEVVVVPQPVEVVMELERKELSCELTLLQRALLHLINRQHERYFGASRLHAEINAYQVGQSNHTSTLDEEGLYRNFDGIDCSLDGVRRDLHFLAALGLLKELALPAEDEIGDMQFITVYRSLHTDDDSQQEDLMLLNDEFEKEVLV